MPVVTGPLALYYQSVDELPYKRTGTPFNAGGAREYTRKFRVIVKLMTMGPLDVCFCPGLPLIWSPYMSVDGSEFDLLSRLVKYEAEQEHDDDWQNWIVTASYSTNLPPGGIPDQPGSPGQPSGGQKNPGAEDDPTLEPWDVKWGNETVQRALRYDLKGKAFVNSANQPFSPPPTFEFAHPILMVDMNVPDFDWQAAHQWAFAVNDSTFLGAEAGCAQMMPLDAQLKFKGDFSYWRLSVKIRFAKELRSDGTLDTFNPIQILDAGTAELNIDPDVGELKTPKPIIRPGTGPIQHPVLLDGAGKEGKPNTFGVIPPVELSFYVYPAKDFNSFFTKGYGKYIK